MGCVSVLGWLAAVRVRCGGGIPRRLLHSLSLRLSSWYSSAVRSARLVGFRRFGGSSRPYKENLRKRPPRVGIFPASGLSRSAPRGTPLAGARPPCSSRSAAVRVSPVRGWGGLCALVFGFWSVVCVRLCLASTGVTRSAVCPLFVVWWPRSVEGPLMPAAFGCWLLSACGRKNAECC